MLQAVWDFPGGSDGKASVYLQCGRPGFDPWVGKIPWRRKWQSTPVFLPGKSHGKRSLIGHSPWGCKELDMTEQLHFHLWLFWGFPGCSDGKESVCSVEDPGLIPGSGRFLWRREWQPSLVSLPGEFHGTPEEPSRLQSMGSQRVGHD